MLLFYFFVVQYKHNITFVILLIMPPSAGVFDCYKLLNRGCFTRAVVFQILFVIGFFVLFAVALASFQNTQTLPKETVEMKRNITNPGADVVLFSSKVTIVGIDPQSNALRLTASVTPADDFTDSQARTLVGFVFYVGTATATAAVGGNADLTISTQVTLNGMLLSPVE